MKPDRATLDYGPSRGTSVADLGRGATARVTRIAGGASLSQRIRMVGIRPGVDVRVLHGPDRRGVVLRVGGTRIALGRAVIHAVLVEPSGPGDAGVNPPR